MPGKHSFWSLEIVSLANLFICKRPKILEDSMLSRSERRRIPQSENNQLGHSLNSECPSLFCDIKHGCQRISE